MFLLVCSGAVCCELWHWYREWVGVGAEFLCSLGESGSVIGGLLLASSPFAPASLPSVCSGGVGLSPGLTCSLAWLHPDAQGPRCLGLPGPLPP